VIAVFDNVFQRGLQQRVLMAVLGEFGRTPRVNVVNGRPGREHYPQAMSILVSGGGSAMIEWPISEDITLADLQTANQVLVNSAASIGEINAVRRAFSAVKGGRLASRARNCDQVTLIVSDVPAAVAGMFTTNQVCAAPVKVSAKRAAKKLARAIVVNSGNANACTGRQGVADAQQMARLTAASVAALYERRKNSPAVIDRRYSYFFARLTRPKIDNINVPPIRPNGAMK